jgi:hypothetical protein
LDLLVVVDNTPKRVTDSIFEMRAQSVNATIHGRNVLLHALKLTGRSSEVTRRRWSSSPGRCP